MVWVFGVLGDGLEPNACPFASQSSHCCVCTIPLPASIADCCVVQSWQFQPLFDVLNEVGFDNPMAC